MDTGQACHLLGANARRLLGDRTLLGRLLETFVVSELRKQISWAAPQKFVYADTVEADAAHIIGKVGNALPRFRNQAAARLRLSPKIEQ